MSTRVQTQGAQIFEAVEGLQRANTVDDVLDVMQEWDALQEVRADMACLAFLPRPDQNFKEVSLAIRVPTEWQELYMSEGFCHFDPALRYCQYVVEPFEWQSAPLTRR